MYIIKIYAIPRVMAPILTYDSVHWGMGKDSMNTHSYTKTYAYMYMLSYSHNYTHTYIETHKS